MVRIPITGPIELGLAPFVERALEEAAREGAVAAILDLDTPGGRVDAAWQIIDAVRDAELPVYALGSSSRIPTKLPRPTRTPDASAVIHTRTGTAHISNMRKKTPTAEQENRSTVEAMRAEVVKAEAKVPLAIAEAFRAGDLDIMDYVKYCNIQIDIEMQRSIAIPPDPTTPPTD